MKLILIKNFLLWLLKQGLTKLFTVNFLIDLTVDVLGYIAAKTEDTSDDERVAKIKAALDK